ncbi:hypothetical protein GCK72_016757 [Caenorhabditis remanei]|uniref:Zinc metalloproteinase n=1 Tax=Caenorhabditis remanei TaxID=31234 RepID=A0A6A5G5H5_CAERE|nr:hypothetical protein GCK72_016757 [Caenorhabditis remanei]KAF1750210.1 hypothetical protein GCK72_016757 [Caenorhabditis remanei]
MRFAMNLKFIALTVGVVFGDYDIRDKRQALPWATKWPDNTMNYYFDNSLPYEMRAMFRDAFQYLSSHSCLNFNYNEIATSSVRIQLGDFCNSALGMVDGEHQTLNFAYHCAAFGVALHETMHALGFHHGQARSDRDQYIVVDSDDHNDEIHNTINPVPFDYGSIMLYWRDQFRWPKDPEYNYTMGNLRVAFYDMILLNDFYGCNCDNHPTKLDCKNGGYQNPANCDECLCTDGFGGEVCDEFVGKVIPASTEWIPVRITSFPNMKGIERTTVPPNNTFIITAPEGSTIEVRLTKLYGFYCHDFCDYNGVELKYKTDRRIVSPMVCCDDDNLWNKTRSSTNNPFVIVQYGEYKTPIFDFEFRYVPGNSTSPELTNEITFE